MVPALEADSAAPVPRGALEPVAASRAGFVVLAPAVDSVAPVPHDALEPRAESRAGFAALAPAVDSAAPAPPDALEPLAAWKAGFAALALEADWVVPVPRGAPERLAAWRAGFAVSPTLAVDSGVLQAGESAPLPVLPRGLRRAAVRFGLPAEKHPAAAPLLRPLDAERAHCSPSA